MEKALDQPLSLAGGGPAKARLRVAVAQVDAEPGDWTVNLPKVQRLIEDQRGKSDLLVLPEYSLTGFLEGQAAHEAALDIDGPRFRELMASTDGITLGLSFIEKTEGGRFFDSLAFIGDGKLHAIHRKIHLMNQGPFHEGASFSHGQEHRCFNLGLFRLAPFICADAWNPALVHLAAMDGAQVLVFAAGSSAHGLSGSLSTPTSWRRINRFYSSIYGSYVLFVNRIGRDGAVDFWGGSQILNPYGEVITEAATTGEAVVTADLDLLAPDRARRELPAFTGKDIDFRPQQAETLEDALVQRVSALTGDNAA